jgi:class 3 adenylate cyclase
VSVPETRYTRSGDVSIAYQVVGEGPDLLWIPAFAQHLELMWEEPYRRAWLEDLASTFRLITFDKRGTGLSDRVHGDATLDERMDDLRAVLDAAGSQSASIFAAGDGAALALVFAASHPSRARALVLWDGAYRGAWAPDFPWAAPREHSLRGIDEFERRWPDSLREVVARGAPSLPVDDLDAFARVLRLSVSPGAAAAYMRMNLDADVRGVLPSVRVPTLIVHGESFPDVDGARLVAEQIPGAELELIDRPDFIPMVGDTSPLLDSLRRFVERASAATAEPDRVLATVLFTDIIDSTATAVELGDRAWRSLLERHNAAVRTELARHRGIEHDTAGDGFFASFDGPARAIRCATAIQAALEPLGLQVRAGLHTGECEHLDGKVAGIAVSIGARVAARATAGEVLVSQTVKDLVAGSGIAFAERGSAELKGVPGEWRLYAVIDA